MIGSANAHVDGVLLGVDVGGTFTDAVALVGEKAFSAKVPTTPDQGDAVLEAVECVLRKAEATNEDVCWFAHGMTVGTNALLEERGAKTALVTTAGFEDVLEIGRQNRPDLYRPCASKPDPLVPAGRRFGVKERMSPSGTVVPLDRDSVTALVPMLEATGAESVAVCLLFSFLDPGHERTVVDILRARLPGVNVTASHEVLNVFREYERTSTTVIDAYLTPVLAKYLSELADRAREKKLPEPSIMLSTGGVLPASAAAAHAAWTVLSGPAAGAVGTAWLGRRTGTEKVLSFDMGGTSCDVAVVNSGVVHKTNARSINGRVLQLPMVDVHTIGAGGGSIAWRDAGGALGVGPKSAGSYPGPACYGRGGDKPTVTDANLLLGYLDCASPLGADVSLDRDRALDAVAKVASQLGLGVMETAAGIRRVVEQEMIGALRVVTVERGIDPREYALLAFGGAGPMHATSMARDLGITAVLCPLSAGVLSAFGMLVAERRRDVAETVLLSGAEITSRRLGRIAEALVEEARRDMPDGNAVMGLDVRYRGQSHELALDGSGTELLNPALVRERFEALHRTRYGYVNERAEIEVVNIRIAVCARGARSDFNVEAALEEPKRRSGEAVFGGEQVETEIVTGVLPVGCTVRGPAICRWPEATVVIEPGWHGTVDRTGTLVLRDESCIDESG